MPSKSIILAFGALALVIKCFAGSTDSFCDKDFENYSNKIIRTEESKEMGGKYLGSKDVPSEIECLKFCCGIVDCNVFVYDNKNSGSCYLFDCGDGEEFKCKFTKHANYTSAIFFANGATKLIEHEDAEFAKNELELAALKASEPVIENGDDVSEVARIAKVEESNELPGKKCSPYQFKCRKSGECIGIYNACDGIAQCVDGSDEGIELGCPGQTTVAVKMDKGKYYDPSGISATKMKISFPENTGYRKSSEKAYISPQESNKGHWKESLGKLDKLEADIYMDRTKFSDSLWGENMPKKLNRYYPSADGKMYSRNYGPLRNFNRNDNGILLPYDGNKNNFRGPKHHFEQFENDVASQDGYYSYGNYNPWQRNDPDAVIGENPHLPSDIKIDVRTSRPIILHEVGGNKVKLILEPEKTTEKASPRPVMHINPDPASNGPYSATAYTATMLPMDGRIFYQIFNTTEDETNDTDSATATSMTEIAHDVTSAATPSLESIQNVISITTEPITTLPANPTPTLVKIEFEEDVDDEEDVDSNVDDVQVNVVGSVYTQEPRGAILALTIGLVAVLVMVVFVGRRFNVVGKDDRRGNSPYAYEDGTFLVNGMYL